MAADKIINSTALQYFKNKLVALIPTKTSDLTNDSRYIAMSGTPTDGQFLVYSSSASAFVPTTLTDADATSY